MKEYSLNKKSKLTYFTLTAMFSALICVATMFLKIPTPLGYQHAGDAIVYLAACILPLPYGLIAAALGGALSDLLSGYAVWILPTLIIKLLNAVPFALARLYASKKPSNSTAEGKALKKRKDKIINATNIIMLLPTSAITIVGYTLATTLIYDWKSALVELAVLWVQPVISAILFILLGAALDTFKFKAA